MSYTKIKNIILDMDGTLLDYVPPHFDNNNTFNKIPIARPYLNLFMKYLFDNFERVSIWTAASESWYVICYERVLKNSLPEGKEFHFVKTRDNYNSNEFVKPLQIIYEEYPHLYTSENTIIIDDNRFTFVENYEQAIQIKPFFYDRLSKSVRENLDKHDFELYNMIQILHQRNYSYATPFIKSTPSQEEQEPPKILEIWIPSEEEYATEIHTLDKSKNIKI